MKRMFFSILLSSILVLSGCTSAKTLKCSATYSKDDTEFSEDMNIKYTDDAVIYIEDVVVYEPGIENMQYLFANGNSYDLTFLKDVDGLSMTYYKIDDTKVRFVTKISYAKLDSEKLVSVLGEEYLSDVDSLISAGGQDIETFKLKNLSGFTCK